jgi:polyisoprenoid-binding protein YceI
MPRAKTRPFHRLALATATTLALTAQALAAPVPYALQPEASSVGFETDFGQDKITGRMPVARAELSLDLDTVSNSTVAVTLDVANANASFPFAAQAMKGPKVLDAEAFPEISFVSTGVRRQGDGAAVDGNITIRGVTRPITFNAQIWRQQDTEAGDLSRLTLRLTGKVRRSDFGATGWNDLVGDEVRLDILARITREN